MTELYQLAARFNPNIAALNFFIQSGANINGADAHGMTGPYWAAKANTKVEIIHFLLDNGAEIDAKDQKCLTPLHYSAAYMLRGAIQTRNFFLLYWKRAQTSTRQI